jgi:co-chaperonin GroES (HSP10)
MLKPTPTNILLSWEELKQASGIILPDEKKNVKLIVKSVADGSTFKKGQEVILSGDARMAKLTRDDETVYLVKEDDVVAIEVNDK